MLFNSSTYLVYVWPGLTFWKEKYKCENQKYKFMNLGMSYLYFYICTRKAEISILQTTKMQTGKWHTSSHIYHVQQNDQQLYLK